MRSTCNINMVQHAGIGMGIILICEFKKFSERFVLNRYDRNNSQEQRRVNPDRDIIFNKMWN